MLIVRRRSFAELSVTVLTSVIAHYFDPIRRRFLEAIYMGEFYTSFTLLKTTPLSFPPFFTWISEIIVLCGKTLSRYGYSGIVWSTLPSGIIISILNVTSTANVILIGFPDTASTFFHLRYLSLGMPAFTTIRLRLQLYWYPYFSTTYLSLYCILALS